jgi:exopolyphosphatase/guanosine-5'-triphosphate,3'-diphosphate pyrophosphatase
MTRARLEHDLKRPGGGEKQAVIDIGSNSVRLVIYEGPKRAPFPICNEKALCGLGRDVDDDGALDADAMSSALSTLRRFRVLLAEHGDPPVRVIATAAVREAENGAEFVDEVRRIGFDIAVIDGETEARLAALGVVSFEPGATGLVGDLGGGSLELVALKAGRAGAATSLSIGPLRLMQRYKADMKAATKAVEDALSGAPWIRSRDSDVFYAVGGAWRALARIHMGLKQHPLPILHHYEMRAADAADVCELIAKQSRSSLGDMPGVSMKRLDTLPYAAMILRSVIARSECSRIITSAGGVREGALFDEMSEDERALDPLLVGARYLANRISPSHDFGDAAEAFIAPLFAGETAAARRIRIASAILVDVAAWFHPDLRGEQAFDTAARAPFVAITHAERAMIAYALFVRHDGAKANPPGAIVALLSEEERQRAARVGLALRFATALSPKAAHPFSELRLAVDNGALTLCGPARYASLMEETPRQRFAALSAAFGLKPVERLHD